MNTPRFALKTIQKVQQGAQNMPGPTPGAPPMPEGMMDPTPDACGRWQPPLTCNDASRLRPFGKNQGLRTGMLEDAERSYLPRRIWPLVAGMEALPPQLRGFGWSQT